MMGERLFEFDSEIELVEAFECFDENDMGMVKVDEMKKWLSEVGDRMDAEEVSNRSDTLQLYLMKRADRPITQRTIY